MQICQYWSNLPRAVFLFESRALIIAIHVPAQKMNPNSFRVRWWWTLSECKNPTKNSVGDSHPPVTSASPKQRVDWLTQWIKMLTRYWLLWAGALAGERSLLYASVKTCSKTNTQSHSVKWHEWLGTWRSSALEQIIKPCLCMWRYKCIRNSFFFSIAWYFQGSKMVCIGSLVRTLSKMKDLCICMWLWTKIWQKSAPPLCRAEWVDRGSTAVFLSHHYSILFFCLSVFSSVTPAQWGDQQRRLTLLRSQTYIIRGTYTE